MLPNISKRSRSHLYVPKVIDEPRRRIDTQQIQRGGGYVFSGTSQGQRIPSDTMKTQNDTFQPFGVQVVNPFIPIKKQSMPNLRGPEVTQVKKQSQKNYQGLSLLKNPVEVQTSTFFFDKTKLASISQSEHSTEIGRSTFFSNNIWRTSIPATEDRTFQNQEKPRQIYQKKISLLVTDTTAQNINRRVRQTFKKFKIHDPLLLKSSENLAAHLRNQSIQKKIKDRQEMEKKSVFEMKKRPPLIYQLSNKEKEIIKSLEDCCFEETQRKKHTYDETEENQETKTLKQKTLSISSRKGYFAQQLEDQEEQDNEDDQQQDDEEQEEHDQQQVSEDEVDQGDVDNIEKDDIVSDSPHEEGNAHISKQKSLQSRNSVTRSRKVSQANSRRGSQASVEINFDEIEKNPVFDHVAQNKKVLTTKKDMIHKLHYLNRELSQQNIPKLLSKTNFDRYELHTTYNLYTALQMITSQRYRFYNPDDGLDYDTFRNGIYQVFMQSEELARKIFAKIDFNYSGFLNWNEFLDLMVIIRAKTLKEKIDLFIKIADEDGNGSLSKDEIFNLSKVCLSRYVVQDTKGGEEFLDMLCEYFTRLIFECVEIDIDDEIPMERIKEAILSGNKESDLLCMFCGADM